MECPWPDVSHLLLFRGDLCALPPVPACCSPVRGHGARGGGPGRVMARAQHLPSGSSRLRWPCSFQPISIQSMHWGQEEALSGIGWMKWG